MAEEFSRNDLFKKSFLTWKDAEYLNSKNLGKDDFEKVIERLIFAQKNSMGRKRYKMVSASCTKRVQIVKMASDLSYTDSEYKENITRIFRNRKPKTQWYNTIAEFDAFDTSDAKQHFVRFSCPKKTPKGMIHVSYYVKSKNDKKMIPAEDVCMFGVCYGRIRKVDICKEHDVENFRFIPYTDEELEANPKSVDVAIVMHMREAERYSGPARDIYLMSEYGIIKNLSVNNVFAGQDYTVFTFTVEDSVHIFDEKEHLTQKVLTDDDNLIKVVSDQLMLEYGFESLNRKRTKSGKFYDMVVETEKDYYVDERLFFIREWEEEE